MFSIRLHNRKLNCFSFLFVFFSSSSSPLLSQFWDDFTKIIIVVIIYLANAHTSYSRLHSTFLCDMTIKGKFIWPLKSQEPQESRFNIKKLYTLVRFEGFQIFQLQNYRSSFFYTFTQRRSEWIVNSNSRHYTGAFHSLITSRLIICRCVRLDMSKSKSYAKWWLVFAYVVHCAGYWSSLDHRFFRIQYKQMKKKKNGDQPIGTNLSLLSACSTFNLHERWKKKNQRENIKIIIIKIIINVCFYRLYIFRCY